MERIRQTIGEAIALIQWFSECAIHTQNGDSHGVSGHSVPIGDNARVVPAVVARHAWARV